MSAIALQTEDDVLLYTRGKRVELATHLTKDGAPKDKDEQQVLLATLDGLDRSALSSKRIKVEEQATKNMTGQAAMIAAVLASVDPRTTMRFRTERDPETVALPSSIPHPAVVEGELEDNPGNLDYDTFMKQFQPT